MIPLWVKALIIGAAVAGYSCGIFWLGGEHARKVAAKDKLDDVLNIVVDTQKKQKDLQESINKMPRSEKTIREIVRQNPAPCPMPKPVSDGLREAIGKANASRKMPSDS